jgi:hypothetical protein
MAAEADNHSDISPYLSNQQFTGLHATQAAKGRPGFARVMWRDHLRAALQELERDTKTLSLVVRLSARGYTVFGS